MSGTEQSILDNIPGLGDDSVADVGSSSGGSGGGGDSGDNRGSSNDGRSSAQPASRSDGTPADRAAGGVRSDTDAGNPVAQPQTVVRRHDGMVEVPNAENPNVRDLVDPVTGRVVARGGIERRVYEEGQRHARENTALTRKLQAAEQQLNGTNRVMSEAQRLNISPEQHQVALGVMADFVRDPVKTLEYLVAEVKSKGYQIPFLEQGVTQGMDLTAIQRMIDNKLAPLTQQQQAAQQQQRAHAAAEQELDAFISENQESRSNLDVLGEMMQAKPGLSLDRAYTLMIKWANDNGLDYTQSLKQQIAAARQRAAQPSNGQQSTPARPLPGPRSAQNNGARVAEGGMFREDASWSEIIRQSMADSGFNLQH